MARLERVWWLLAVVLLVDGCGKKKQEPEVSGQLGAAKVDTAKAQIRQLIDVAYPQWSSRHPTSSCPDGLAELEPSASKRRDPWGNELVLRCVDGFGVTSHGPDGKPGTADDINLR